MEIIIVGISPQNRISWDLIGGIGLGKGIGACSKEQIVLYLFDNPFPASNPAGKIVCLVILGQGGDSLNNGRLGGRGLTPLSICY